MALQRMTHSFPTTEGLFSASSCSRFIHLLNYNLRNKVVLNKLVVEKFTMFKIYKYVLQGKIDHNIFAFEK